MPSWLERILNCNITFTDNPKDANCITHNGNFHADDVFCNVFFGKFLPEAIIYRCGQTVPDETKRNPNAYIYDTGYGELDHHQKNKNGYHPNSSFIQKGIPYAAFGLVWRKFGKEFCDRIANEYGNSELSQFLWDWMENNLVIAIDAADNGIYPRTPYEYEGFRILTVSNMITLFAPTPCEDQDYTIPLKYATQMASLVFDMTIQKGIWVFEHPKNENQISFYFSQFRSSKIFTEVVLKHIFPDISEERIGHLSFEKDINFLYHTPRFNSIQEKEPIPTSSLGIIWEKYGKNFCMTLCQDNNSAEYIWNHVKNELVIGVDAFSNAIKPVTHWDYVPYSIYTVSDFFANLSPMDYSPGNYRLAYEIALFWANAIFERILKKALDRINTRSYIEERIEASTYHTLLLDRFVHWQEWVNSSSNPKAKDLWFVVFPSNKGNYNIQPIPYKHGPNGYRKGFPKDWFGCNSKELQDLTGIPTAVFVHDEGFIGGTDDLIGAILMVMKASEMS